MSRGERDICLILHDWWCISASTLSLSKAGREDGLLSTCKELLLHWPGFDAEHSQ